jgi:radical SAM superfamily enzyme YgiQ (UPF0313 family)
MKYEGMIIRPPSEAYSLLLQVTVGCSHNECTFCGTYKDKKFRIKNHEEINVDILEAGKYYQSVEKVFLCDGDALIVPQRQLVPILESIKGNIHGVKRIGTYANTKSILRKSREELLELKERGLGIVYLGVETGNETLLRRIKKDAGYEEIVRAGRRIKEAGITLSVTVLLGIGGTERNLEHATDTARILSEIDPDYVGVLTVMIIPGTPLYDDHRFCRFELPGQFELLQELAIMISCSSFSNCFFTANHASNYLPIRARMPQDKDKVVSMIEEVIRKGDPTLLKPEYMRGL